MFVHKDNFAQEGTQITVTGLQKVEICKTELYQTIMDGIYFKINNKAEQAEAELSWAKLSAC